MAALQDGRDGMFVGAAISRPKAFHWGVVAAKEGGEHMWVFVGRDDLGAPLLLDRLRGEFRRPGGE